MIRALLLARALLVLTIGFFLAAPALAVTDTCTVSGTVVMDGGPADGTLTGGGSIACTGGDSTRGADDHFVVESGATLTITATWTQTTGSSPDNGIEVESGGTLNVTVSTAAFVVTVGPDGISCLDGATCNFTGGWRLPDNTITTDYATAKAEHWAISEVMPCPIAVDHDGGGTDFYEPDCSNATAKTQGGLLFQASRTTAPAASSTDPTLRTALDAIDVSGGLEVLHFFPAGDGATYRAADELAMYQITGLVAGTTLGFGSANDRLLVLDILQSDARDPVASDADMDCDDAGVDSFPGEEIDGYTYAKRAFAESLLTAAINPGDESFRVATGLGSEPQIITCTATGSTYQEVGKEYIGRWVRFLAPYSPDATCDGATDSSRCIADSRRVYRIMDREEDPYSASTDDRFYIAQITGFEESRASGAQLFVDQGWVTGDPFIVMLPVWVRSSTTGTTQGESQDSEMRLDGVVATNGAVFDKLGTFRTGGALEANGIDIDLQRTWIRDGSGERDYWQPNGFQRPGVEVIRLEDVQYTPGNTFTGGGADPTSIRSQHFLVPQITHGTVGQTQGNITLRNVMFRYAEDDSVGMVQGACAINIDAKYIRSQYASMGGGSLGTFDMQTISTPDDCRLTIVDAECIVCGDDVFAGAAASIDGLLMMNNGMSAWGSQGTTMDASVSGYTNLGGSFFENGGPWAPCGNDATSTCNASDFVVRDLKIVNDNGSNPTVGRPLSGGAHLRNGLLNRVSWGGSYIVDASIGSPKVGLTDGHLVNVAFVDNDVFDIPNTWCDGSSGGSPACTAVRANHSVNNSVAIMENISFFWTSNFAPRTWVRRPGRFAAISRTSKGACGNVSDCFFGARPNVAMAMAAPTCTGCSITIRDFAYMNQRAPICGTGAVGAENCNGPTCLGCQNSSWDSVFVLGTAANPARVLDGEWCLLNNVAYNDSTLAEDPQNITAGEIADLVAAGADAVYTTTAPAVMSDSDGNLRIGVADKMAACGVRDVAPGVRRRYRYHQWGKLQPENLANLSGSGWHRENRRNVPSLTLPAGN